MGADPQMRPGIPASLGLHGTPGHGDAVLIDVDIQAVVGVYDLIDQVLDLVVVEGPREQPVGVGLVLDHDLPGGDAFRLQVRIALHGLGPGGGIVIGQLIGGRGTVGGPEQVFQGGPGRDLLDQPQARIDGPTVTAVVVIAKTQVEQPVGMQTPLVLGEQAIVAVQGRNVRVGLARGKVPPLLVVFQVLFELHPVNGLVACVAQVGQARLYIYPAPDALVLIQVEGVRHAAVAGGIVAKPVFPVIRLQVEVEGRHQVALVVRGQTQVLIVDGAARVVDQGVEGRGRVGPFALGPEAGQAQAALAQAGKGPVGGLPIQVVRPAIVVLRGIQFREIEIGAAGLGGAGGDQPVALPLGVPGGEPAPPQTQIAHIQAHIGPRLIRPGAGNDVDHAEEGVVAVDRGPGTGDELDAVYQFHIHRELGTQVGGVVDVVVDTHPIDQQQDVVVVIAGTQEAPWAYVAVGPVEGRHGTADAGQGLEQAAPAVGTDLIGADDADRRGRLARLLGKA